METENIIKNETRQSLGEKYNKWLLDNKRKDGNYSNTVFDFLFSPPKQEFFEDGFGEHQYFTEKQ